jgi:hypothetical protein
VVRKIGLLIEVMLMKFLTVLMIFSAVLLCQQMCIGRTVEITVNPNAPGQVWEGWGCTDLFSFDGLQVDPEAGSPGSISTEAREQILKLYYGDLGMTRIRIWPMGYEPEVGKFVWEGRGTRPVNSLNPFCKDHIVMGRKYRSTKEPFVLYPSAHQWESWMAAKPQSQLWMWGDDAKFNPAMVDKYADHALAGILHVKEVYHYEIPYWSLFNEPTNTAMLTKETTLALVLASGRTFAENHLKTKLVICDDVTPEDSAETIEYVLANKEARKYVGAVSYHRYRGDFVLEQVKPMLTKAGKGELLVKEPVSFYKNALKYGKSVWLSEQCSYGDNGITMFDAGRARSNHICDEINQGKVNAFDFMLPYFIERGRPGNEEAPIFLRFKDKQFISAEINPFGSWISQFTRYIRPGARQLRVDVGDPVVKAVAFRHAKNRTLTVVVVNNKTEAVDLDCRLEGMNVIEGFTGNAHRIRTSENEARAKLRDCPVSNGRLVDVLPGLSVTTYVVETRD